MDAQDVFNKHRRILLIAQLLRGRSLAERIRNLTWILELLNNSDGSWLPDELIIVAEESSPFLPAKALLAEISHLKLLTSDGGSYKLVPVVDLYEKGLHPSIEPKDCTLSIEEIIDFLQGGPAKRSVWKRSTLVSILRSVIDFGFHCLGSWRATVFGGKQLVGVPFLWNVDEDGNTSPMGDLPASSATVDILRLAVEPLSVTERAPSNTDQALIEWAFDQIHQKIAFLPDGSAYYQLSVDDSYPVAAHPINDTQSRVIHLLVQLLKIEPTCLDTKRREHAYNAVIGLTRYLVSEQFVAPGEKYDGFWSFHKYGDPRLDAFQVLTINSELAVRALAGAWAISDDPLKESISLSVGRLLAALRRTAIRDNETIGWQQHFSTLERESSDLQNKSETAMPRARPCELFATARGMLIFATATAMGVCEDGLEYVQGGLRFLEQNWVFDLRDVEEDVEFIPYRSPEIADWSDGTYRITNPISAILPYYVLKTLRLVSLPLPIMISEPVNNCLSFALGNYEGHGFWRDAETALAYPTNTAFNMEMLIEYLRASDTG